MLDPGRKDQHFRCNQKCRSSKFNNINDFGCNEIKSIQETFKREYTMQTKDDVGRKKM